MSAITTRLREGSPLPQYLHSEPHILTLSSLSPSHSPQHAHALVSRNHSSAPPTLPTSLSSPHAYLTKSRLLSVRPFHTPIHFSPVLCVLPQPSSMRIHRPPNAPAVTPKPLNSPGAFRGPGGVGVGGQPLDIGISNAVISLRKRVPRSKSTFFFHSDPD